MEEYIEAASYPRAPNLIGVPVKIWSAALQSTNVDQSPMTDRYLGAMYQGTEI